MIIDNLPARLELVASLVRALGDDVYEKVIKMDPELEKRVEYAKGFTDGSYVVEQKIALRLLTIGGFSLEHVSPLMDMPIEKVLEIENRSKASSPADLPT